MKKQLLKLSSDSYVGTGMKVELSKEIEVTEENQEESTPTKKTVTEEYLLLVTGDIDGDGEMNSNDVAVAINYFIGKTEIDKRYFPAIDYDGDGEITAADIITLQLKLV